MKKASWGCFVSVFDSIGEPAGRPEFSEPCAPGRSGTEFEVGRTSCEDGDGATVHAPMDYEASMHFFTCYIKGDLGQFHLCLFSDPIEVPAVAFREGHISTDAEEVKVCHYFSSLGAFSAKCVSVNRLCVSKPQSSFAGAGFQRWYVSFDLRNF